MSEADSIYGFDDDTEAEDGFHDAADLTQGDEDEDDTLAFEDAREAPIQISAPRAKLPTAAKIATVSRKIQEYEVRIGRLRGDIERSQQQIQDYISRLDVLDQDAGRYHEQIDIVLNTHDQDIDRIYTTSNDVLERLNSALVSHRAKITHKRYVVEKTADEIKQVVSRIDNAYESLAFGKMLSQLFTFIGSCSIAIILLIIVLIFWRSADWEDDWRKQ